MEPISLNGKTVLITGASSGIGRELARCFATESARLIITSLPAEKEVLENWAAEMRNRYGIQVDTLTEDLSLADGVKNLYQQVTQIAPHIDVLVNNAGIMAFGVFHELSLEKQEKVVAVNLSAYMALMRLFLPEMVRRGKGAVFNVGSVSAFVPTPRHSVYGATKAFVQSLSEAVHEEVLGAGVRIFTLNPGYSDTPLLQGAGFPEKLRFYNFGGKSDPAVIARKGVTAFKNGKRVYIPEKHLWFLFMVLNRFAPRRLISKISDLMVRAA
jgi:short-subunit dehydrogenase